MIRVNGKKQNNSVDLSKTVELNWKDTTNSQVSYTLTLQTTDGKVIYQIEKSSSAPFTFINIEGFESSKRQKVDVSLKVTDKEANEVSYRTYFYTQNKKLTEAKWITRKDNPIEKESEYYKNRPNTIISQVFHVHDLKDKTFFLDIIGLGYYTVYLNDRRIDDFYLNNDVTNYDHRIYYDTYTLNEYLKEGINKISVELANGWYNPSPLLLLGKYNLRNQLSIGKPCLLAQITELNEDTQHVIIETNNQWQSDSGNYLFDNVYVGERIDYTTLDPKNIEKIIECKTIEIAGPNGQLVPSFIPKIKRNMKLTPKDIIPLQNGYLIEFNQVISGHFSCVFKTKQETTIHLKYSEVMDQDGNLDFASSSPGSYGDLRERVFSPAIQEDQVKIGIGTQYFENQFTYHSFKYVLLESRVDFEIEEIEAYTVHSDMTESSSFDSSNIWMNQLYDIAKATKLNNIHSYYEDCPRERLGYGGDIVALIHSQIHSFHSKELLEKVLDDFLLDQTVDGGITQTAPFMGIQTHGTSNQAGSLGWQYVVPTILKKLIKHYAEPQQYKDKLSFIKKHALYLMKFDYEYIKYCCLGDWGSIDTVLVDGKETPPDRLFCSAVFYLLLLQDYKELIEVISGETEAIFIKELQNKISLVEEAIINEFYHGQGHFGERSQSSYLFALKANLGGNRDLLYANLIEQLNKDKGILRSGIFGMAWIYEILKEDDQSVLYKWLSRKEYPSFSKMLENGANILSEYFTDDPEKYHHVSRNHAMFSSYGSWFIDTVLGIKISDQTYASNHVTIKPYFPEGVTFARGYLDTPHGKIKVSWERVEKGYDYRLYVPTSIYIDWEHDKQLKEKKVISSTEYKLFYNE
jgi:alpha-L-rhamnosidase